MGTVQIIPGSADAGSLCALIVSRERADPSVRLIDVATGSVVPSLLKRAPAHARLRTFCKGQGVTLYRLDASGLRENAPYRIEATGASPASMRTLPKRLPPEGLTIAAGSCFFDGADRHAHVRDALAKASLVRPPSFLMALGDNLYVDVSVSGIEPGGYEPVFKRYLAHFGDDRFAAMRGQLTTFTTYDDHEFWNNFPEAQLWVAHSGDAMRTQTVNALYDCLDAFQSSLNPRPVVEGGRSYTFSIPPLEFFVADVRSQRTHHDQPDRRFMPEAELAALEAWASKLAGPGVLALGQPLWEDAGCGTDYNLPAFGAQYARLWRALRTAPWDVLVVTGDIHYSRLLHVRVGDTDERHVYEFVSSPMTHIPQHLAAFFGLGGQGRAAVCPPASVVCPSEKLRAEYVFGTDVPNTFGLLHFAAEPSGAVTVGASFFDVMRAMTADACACATLPLAHEPPYKACAAPRCFTLKER